MTAAAKVCAITGAGGYLGSRVARAFAERGWDVVPMGRRAGMLPFALGEAVSADALRERQIDTLIHCAHDFSLVEWPDIERVNVQGSRLLFEAARSAGVRRILFISTMSAFAGCTSRYGRAKLAIERDAAACGAALVRPGLIFGDVPGGMVGTLNRLMQLSPVVPLIGSGRQVLYPAHEDDVCALLLRLADAAAVPAEPLSAASERGLELREILHELARRRGRRTRLLPVSAKLIWALLRSAERLGVRLGMRSDSVTSLEDQDPHPRFGGAAECGVAFRTFAG